MFSKISTPKLDPSFIGFKINLYLEIFLSKSDIFFITLYLGVLILFFKNIFFDFILSMAFWDDFTPECVYGIFNFSKIFCTSPSSPYFPCKQLKIISGLIFLMFFSILLIGSNL